MTRSTNLAALGAAIVLTSLAAATLPQVQRSDAVLHVAFVGDTGSGEQQQKDLAGQMGIADELELAFLLGDNVYENGEAENIRPRFLDVYASLMERGVEFHAALGNHDVQRCRGVRTSPVPRDARAYSGSSCDVAEQLDPSNRFGYEGGLRYYSISAGGDPPLLDVFVLDTNTLDIRGSKLPLRQDSAQLAWLEQALTASAATWKVVAMHHPIHSPAGGEPYFFLFPFWKKGHEPERRLRDEIEPLFVAHGVDAVFQGHNHFYARMLPQQGIRYFVSGAGGKGPYEHEPDPGYVVDEPSRGKFNEFVRVRLSEDRFEYCVIDSEGQMRDSGWFRKGDSDDSSFDNPACPF